MKEPDVPVPNVIALSAGVGFPSRTTTLVDAAAKAIIRRIGGRVSLIELSEFGPGLLRKLSRDSLDPSGEALVKRVEDADLLVVGSPVYRGSYTGIFKHLFDLVDHRALTGRVVLLAATGGSLEHNLIIEHQLRPLFGFFGALTVPTGLYAQPADFKDGVISAPGLQQRIERAANEAASLLHAASRPVALADAPLIS
jgi:FMN reductase